MVTADKRQWKRSQMVNGKSLQPLSPPDELWPMSSSLSPNSVRTGRLRHLSEPCYSSSENENEEIEYKYLDSVTSRTLFDLIAVLNTSFPDYDFSHVKSESFSLIPNIESLVGLVDSKLSSTVTNYYELKEALWREVDNVINIQNCKIYSYHTEYSGDPFGEDGVIWSFNYFFCNKLLKRVLFFSCRALRSDASLNLSAEQLWGFEA
ncbi:hypothetical protein AB6A40_006545 [Gnathostoma spinigerum]|uniref:Repressor of RNA polymerase III transcription MAF1 homolog n=1 Tax=Gnathostoma spinigerum TaxID=75299 RepID=A0ABD6EJA8_9BILA